MTSCVTGVIFAMAEAGEEEDDISMEQASDISNEEVLEGENDTRR